LIQYVIIRPISGPDLNSIPVLFGVCWAALLRNIKAEASTGWAETIPWISMELGLGPNECLKPGKHMIDYPGKQY
jgi:hypothetical protein